jgi:predicted ATP-dependent endonuclease of OLD family
MLFNSLDMEFSPDINIISGENSTGKTAILKVLYATTKSLYDLQKSKNEFTKDRYEQALVSKLNGVFRTDNDVIGRLVGRQQGSNHTDVNVLFDNNKMIGFGFGNRQTKHLELSVENDLISADLSPVFIPPKEIISSTGNFTSLYDEYHIEFDETYYDLAKLLLKPLKKGPNTKQQNIVLESFDSIMNGNVVQRENRFYLKVKGYGEFEMGLVSEGFRKLSTMTYLILSGSLNKNAMLFWDEPESNMNPKMIKHMVAALVELSKMGVQVFVTTHSYFVQQCFNLIASYPKANKNKINIKFISLHRQAETGELIAEGAKTLNDLKNNSIMEEFDGIYSREQELM